jgi:hypothetical protein
MSHSDIQSLKAEDLSIKELRLQKAQQAIDDLLMAANSDEFDDDELSEQELELVAGGLRSHVPQQKPRPRPWSW